MPLMVEGCPIGQVPKSLCDFVERFQCFKKSSQELRSKPCKSVSPAFGLLYVGQREMGATTPEDDKVKFIGTEDATTCHMAVLRHTGSGAVCLAHFDGSGIQNAVKEMITVVKSLSTNKPPGSLELHLVGGFCDDDDTSKDLSIKTLRAFHDNPEEIHLLTACITDLNNVQKAGKRGNVPFPSIYGIAVEVNTGNIFPATFPDHGPEMPLRDARHFTGEEKVINIYDPAHQQMTIGPFTYSTMDEIDLLCRMPDHVIRENLSTSPEQEPKGFEDGVRAALKQIRDYPNPKATVFKDNKPKCYEFQNGGWRKVSS